MSDIIILMLTKKKQCAYQAKKSSKILYQYMHDKICFTFSLLFHVVASTPTNLRAYQVDAKTIHVTWSPPSPLHHTTGYQITYTGDSSSDTVTVPGGSTTHYELSNLVNGDNYLISIIGTSDLPSDVISTGVVSLGKIINSQFSIMLVSSHFIPLNSSPMDARDYKHNFNTQYYHHLDQCWQWLTCWWL